jgi:structural maintenance of chromosome 4
LEKKILDIGGARLLSQKSKVDGLKLHINIANDEITKAEVAKAKAEKDVVKLEKSVQTNKDVLSEAEADLEELDREMTECAQAVQEIKDKVEDAKTQEENSKTNLNDVKSQLDDVSEKIRGFKKQEVSRCAGYRIGVLKPFSPLSWPSPRSSKSSKPKGKITRSVSSTGVQSTTSSSSNRSSESWSFHLPMTIADSYNGSDDSEGDDEEEGEEGEEQAENEDEVKSEVKAEGGASKKKTKDSNELYIYQEPELMLLKPNQLSADVQLLDGACTVARGATCSPLLPNREVAKGQAKSRSPQGVQKAGGRVDETDGGSRGYDKTAGRSETTLRSTEKTEVGRVHGGIHGHFVQAEGDVSGLCFTKLSISMADVV